MNRISIIIPTFNRADLIGATLDSILAQTYPYWEALVIDDGSSVDPKSLAGVTQRTIIKTKRRFSEIAKGFPEKIQT
ncbi:MAG: glycosyltransferase family A protein, partial [Marinirhabdus sp.]|nr:glycosyltransferase family A protein [Marinirhabdus sp.]